MRKPLPDQETLRRLLSYNPDTGELRWKERSADLFTAPGRCRWWNRRFGGQLALRAVDTTGSRKGMLLGRTVLAHRVIWKLAHGWDADEIDHINHNRQDNRISNLREVNREANAQNVPLNRRNTSGRVGVYFEGKRSKRWSAKIGSGGRLVNLGRFDTFEQAAAVREAAERRCGYHENHGKAREG
jgi:hypothetical protein